VLKTLRRTFDQWRCNHRHVNSHLVYGKDVNGAPYVERSGICQDCGKLVRALDYVSDADVLNMLEHARQFEPGTVVWVK